MKKTLYFVIPLLIIVIIYGVYVSKKPYVAPSVVQTQTDTQNLQKSFSLNEYSRGEMTSEKEYSFTNSSTKDEVTLKLLTDAAHQSRNPSYGLYVNKKYVGDVGGQGIAFTSFSPDNRYFAFRARSVLGCAGVCQDTGLYLIDLKQLSKMFLQTPSLKEGQGVPHSGQYQNISEFIESYSWDSSQNIQINSYAVGLGKNGLYQINPKETWIYNISTNQYILATSSR